MQAASLKHSGTDFSQAIAHYFRNGRILQSRDNSSKNKKSLIITLCSGLNKAALSLSPPSRASSPAKSHQDRSTARTRPYPDLLVMRRATAASCSVVSYILSGACFRKHSVIGGKAQTRIAPLLYWQNPCWPDQMRAASFQATVATAQSVQLTPRKLACLREICKP